MSDRNKRLVEDETINAAVGDTGAGEFLNRTRTLAEIIAEGLPHQVAAVATAIKMSRDLANGAIENNDAQREILDALIKRAVQAEQPEPEPGEVEARALLDSFDGRITEIERRIDRVLARLDAG